MIKKEFKWVLKKKEIRPKQFVHVQCCIIKNDILLILSHTKSAKFLTVKRNMRQNEVDVQNTVSAVARLLSNLVFVPIGWLNMILCKTVNLAIS
jgi:hypothetical protein